MAHSRRVRQMSRTLWRMAPIAAAACLCTAAAARWTGSSPLWSLTMLCAAGAALGVYGVFATRSGPVSDALAARIDDEARLDGELRSASWFAVRDARDAWAELHLERAIERLESVQIGRLYPAIRATRARLATAVMVLVTLALTLTFPERSTVRAGSTAAAPHAGALPLRSESSRPAVDTAEDLAEQLDALLTAIESGTMPADRTPSAALQRLLAQLRSIQDRQALERLARAMAANAGSTAGLTPQQIEALADRMKRDSAMAGRSEVREALNQLQTELSQLAQAQPSSPGDPRAASKEAQSGDAAEAHAETGADESVVESTTAVQAEGGMGVMMANEESSSISDAPPGLGLGGSQSRADEAGTMAGIQRALRHETIEASANSADGEVISDARRDTRGGDATVGFSGGRAAISDRPRADARAPVPEARRADVRIYFNRKR